MRSQLNVRCTCTQKTTRISASLIGRAPASLREFGILRGVLMRAAAQVRGLFAAANKSSGTVESSRAPVHPGINLRKKYE